MTELEKLMVIIRNSKIIPENKKADDKKQEIKNPIEEFLRGLKNESSNKMAIPKR